MDSERNEAGRRTRREGESGEVTTEAGRFFRGDGDEGGREVGRSGNVAEGTGLGEGIFRSDSFEVLRRAGSAGTGIIGLSVRLRTCEVMLYDMT